MRLNLKLMCLGTLVCVMPACADLGAIEALRDDAQQARVAMVQRAEQLERLRESFPETDPARAEIDATLAQTRAAIGLVDAGMMRINQVLDEAADPSDGLTRTAQQLGPFLPEPVRLPLVLAAALGATLLRSGQIKKGAISIALSIDKAMEGDEAFRDALARNANTLRALQTPTGRKIVDQAGSRNFLASLPI